MLDDVGSMKWGGEGDEALFEGLGGTTKEYRYEDQPGMVKVSDDEEGRGSTDDAGNDVSGASDGNVDADNANGADDADGADSLGAGTCELSPLADLLGVDSLGTKKP